MKTCMLKHYAATWLFLCFRWEHRVNKGFSRAVFKRVERGRPLCYLFKNDLIQDWKGGGMKSRKLVTCMIGLCLVLWSFGMVAAADPIQVQLSTDGNLEASLIGVKIRSEVLTVKVIIQNTSDRKVTCRFEFRQVYYTDLKERKKYFGLKDSKGAYIAGPKFDTAVGGRFWFKLQPGEKRIMWVKFPAPPPTTESIDLFIPGFLPFEDVPLGR